MHQITVVSLGGGARQQLTIGVVEQLKKSKRVILRTGEVDAAAYLREQGIAFDTLDKLHEACEDFDELIAQAVATVAKAAGRCNVVYAVLDALSDETAAALKARYPENVTFAGGTPLCAPLLQAAGAALPVRVVTASSLDIPSTQDGLLVTEITSRFLAGECKLKLSEWYGDGCEILFFPPAEKETRAFVRLPLCEMDRQKRYDHTTAVYLPALPLEKRARFDLWDLVRMQRALRGEGGCSWNQAQTHKTLARYLIEEAYETSEAIDREDWAHVADELGDVWLQIVFQADIGAQYGTFTLSDVSSAICRKLLERHAGDFPGETKEEIALAWERMKQAQRGNTTMGEALRDVSGALPALLQAEKILKKAEKLGLKTDSLWQDGTAGALLQAAEALRQRELSPEEEVRLALGRYIQRVENAENRAKGCEKAADSLTSDEINVYLSEDM